MNTGQAITPTWNQNAVVAPLTMMVPMNQVQYVPQPVQYVMAQQPQMVLMASPSQPQMMPAHCLALPRRPVYKTKMCRGWMSGVCTYGDKCMFAHGQDDIVHTPDPTSTKKVLTEEQRNAEAEASKQLVEELKRRRALKQPSEVN